MTIEEVKDLMKSSKSAKEWDDNCDKVKEYFKGYPDWWYREIVLSGIHFKIRCSWTERYKASRVNYYTMD